MNYLAHHFFDRVPDDPLHNVGLILPDFSRSARGRRKLLLANVRSDIYGFASLLKGCHSHYVSDEWFHESLFFHILQDKISRILKENARLFSKQRPWFVSHILAELLLDRLIIKRFPGSLDLFYSDLQTVDIGTITQFLEACGKSSFEQFTRHYRNFCESKFMYSYSDDEGLVYSLDRVIQRTGQNALDDDAFLFLIKAIPELEHEASRIKKPRQMARLSEISS